MLSVPLQLAENTSSEGPAMFEFDEETETREKNKENSEKTEVEVVSSDDEPEIENYKRPVMKVSTDIFGTSLPVSIPR